MKNLMKEKSIKKNISTWYNFSALVQFGDKVSVLLRKTLKKYVYFFNIN